MIKTLKKEEGMIIESDDIILISLLNEYLNDKKDINFSGFVREHPFLANPKLVICAKNPEKAIEQAKKEILEDIKSLKNSIKK